jgi:hypothetical protein
MHHYYYKTGSELITLKEQNLDFYLQQNLYYIIGFSLLMALIHSSSSLKSPGPDLAPGTPPSALTEKDMPRTRDGFISISASITFPLQVGTYRARGIWSIDEITKHMQSIEIHDRK